ncbi:hypothetical protein TOPH_05752 [Tolypocladium ophioglossoides CBS 100239]|uniref:Uncharacterized protein n=1 Tax=Tolypocladium ophioglossoides (strain CBS 100239) TaxID=1163406 RepID=A0A0L0N6F5_TOLOC|nr:hypothetical protein TOPH_05752 [Tolypocladium ophioglossoides CBS 100239]
MSHSSSEGPPQPHPDKARRDAHDAKSPAPHSKHGLALQDGGPLFLELRHAGEVAVRSQPEEGATPCARSACALSMCDWVFGGRLAYDLATEAIVASVLAHELLEVLWPFEGMHVWDIVARHRKRPKEGLEASLWQFATELGELLNHEDVAVLGSSLVG